MNDRLKLIFIKIHLNKDSISDPRASRINTPESYAETSEINGSSSMGKRISYTARCFSCNPPYTHALHRRINITYEAGQGHSGSESSDTVAKVSGKKKKKLIICSITKYTWSTTCANYNN